MQIELKIEQVKEKFSLSSVHIFDQGDWGLWRVFGFRKTAEGFNSSVAEGYGGSIAQALDDMADNLRIGPVNAGLKKKALLERLAAL